MNQFFKKQLQMFFSGREEFVNAEYIGRAVYVKLDKDLKCKAEFVTRGVHEQYEALRLETFNNERKIDSLTLNFSEYFKPYKLGNGGSRTPHIWHDCQKYEWYGTPTAEDRQRLANEVCQYIRMNSSDQVINQRHEKCEAISKIEEFEAKLEGLSECDSTPSFQSDVTLGCPTHLNVSWADGKAWLSLNMCVYDSSSPDELLVPISVSENAPMWHSSMPFLQSLGVKPRNIAWKKMKKTKHMRKKKARMKRKSKAQYRDLCNGSESVLQTYCVFAGFPKPFVIC